jgi:hypothetical protein
MSMTTSVDLPWLHSPLFSIPVEMRHLSDPNFISKIQTSPPPISSWVHAQMSLIFTFRTSFYAIWAISVFLQVSVQIWESHYSWVAGHFGMEKTVIVLEKHFYWPKIRQNINKYIISCITCAIAKSTTKKKGLDTPIPTPQKPWESISMDYMYGLPSTKKGNDFVFVVIDWFSKMVILIACKKNITMEDTAKLLFKQVWVHFGIPQTIISDRDNRFLNTFWSSLWSLLDTNLTKSTAFHPQTDD